MIKSVLALIALISTLACGTGPVAEPGVCIDAEASEDGVRGDDIRLWLPCANSDESATCVLRLLGGVRTYQRAEVVACDECYGAELVEQHPEICPQGGAQ